MLTNRILLSVFLLSSTLTVFSMDPPITKERIRYCVQHQHQNTINARDIQSIKSIIGLFVIYASIHKLSN